MANFYLDQQGLMVPCESDLDVISQSMPDRHMMIDIETLDTDVTAAIVSIAAVTFNPRGNGSEREDKFRLTIDERSNRFHGRTVSDATVAWWETQSLEAKHATFGGPHTELSSALRQFTRWINELRPTCTRVWAKDPDFDISILRHACQSLNLIWPFKFWENRSCRTAMELAYPEGNFPHVVMDGPAHDSLADAQKQVIEIQHVYHVLRC